VGNIIVEAKTPKSRLSFYQMPAKRKFILVTARIPFLRRKKGGSAHGILAGKVAGTRINNRKRNFLLHRQSIMECLPYR
jgi:hypothetical protein